MAGSEAPPFWFRKKGWAAYCLAPLSWAYGAAARWRMDNARPHEVMAPVICIGNAVAGGAGKTPVALSVMEALRRGGVNACFLSRGYGGALRGPLRVDPNRHGADEVGDEPLLLAAAAPTWVSRDRVAGARAAASDGAQAIVMDDGYQNRALRKDISVLVIDGGYGFGNGRVMPAGPLREPAGDAIARADAIAVIGEDTCGIGTALPPGRPVLQARFVPLPDADDISGKPVFAFAGIGRPEKFFETLAGMDCPFVGTRAFADHHPYGEDEIMEIVEAAAAGRGIPVTTEKDAVRLPPKTRPMVRVLRVALEWRDASALDRLLAPITAGKA